MNITNFVAKHRKAMSITSAIAMSAVMGTAVLANTGSVTNNDTSFGLNTFEASTQLGHPAGGLQGTISNLINVALGLLGIIALVIILVGGFEWMTAGGNEEKTAEARKRIFAGIIGLAIILSSYAIARFVISSLATATGSGSTTVAP